MAGDVSATDPSPGAAPGTLANGLVPGAAAGARIYVVDDHAVVRHGLCALLAGAGCVVVGDSGDLDGALGGIAATRPEVVLVDLHLGPRSGLELLAEIARRALPVRLLVLTMSAQPRHVANALAAGARGYVLKGSPSQALLHAIGEVRQGSVHLGEGVAVPAARGPGMPAGGDPIASLSARERQVIGLVVDGRSSAEIAAALHLSPKTVETYRSRLMLKLGVSDITGLVKLAMRHGWADPGQD